MNKLLFSLLAILGMSFATAMAQSCPDPTTNPSNNGYCQVWDGHNCLINVQWLEKLSSDANHSEIQLVAGRDSVFFCTQSTHRHDKFHVDIFRDCRNPSNPATGYPFKKHLSGRNRAHHQSKVADPANSDRACFKTYIVKKDGGKIDPHIIIKTP